MRVSRRGVKREELLAQLPIKERVVYKYFGATGFYWMPFAPSPSLPFHSRKPGRIGKYESFGHYNGPQGEFRSCSEGRLVHSKRHRIDAKCFVDFQLVSIRIGGRADMERVAAPGFEDAGRAHLAPKDPPERRPA